MVPQVLNLKPNKEIMESTLNLNKSGLHPATVDPSIESFLRQGDDSQAAKALLDAKKEIEEEEILKMENNKVAPIALKEGRDANNN